MTQFAD